MPRFFIGDEIGNIKSLAQQRNTSTEEHKMELKILYDASKFPDSIQAMAAESDADSGILIAAARANGNTQVFMLNEEDELQLVRKWKENKMSLEHSYVGLSIKDKKVYSCTSNGALRITRIQDTLDGNTDTYCTALPTRLRDWRLSTNHETFAYGGDEVDLSVWNTEMAFTHQAQPRDSSSRKRKRNELFPGEIWRAKNAPNDNLGLRQPIRITSLTYVSEPSNSRYQLVAGTQMGHLRRYDTRAGRKPVADWHILENNGGIKVIDKGVHDHQLLVGTSQSHLYTIDLRNGRVAGSYKGISGSISSIAIAPSVLATTALDRYARIHSTFPLPADVKHNQDRKGETIDKVFVQSIPTVVVWDQATDNNNTFNEINEVGDDNVWQNMEHVGDESEEETNVKKKAK